MYTKYEEMLMMKRVIKGYVDNLKQQYKSVAERLKEYSNKLDTNIDSVGAKSEISSLQSEVQLLSSCRADYEIGMSVLNELDKATRCFEQAYSIDQLQPGGIVEQRGKEGNRIFYELKTKNDGYKKIIDEISYSLFVAQDSHLNGLENGLDAKLDSLEGEFEQGRLSKDELIYYTNMCVSLSQNHDYVEYISQFQQEKHPQSFHN